LVSLGSWNPLRDSFDAWMKRQLIQVSPALRRRSATGDSFARDLLLSDKVLPILDGFEELPPDRAIMALRRMDYLPEQPGLVLASDTEAFGRAIRSRADVWPPHTLGAAAIALDDRAIDPG